MNEDLDKIIAETVAASISKNREATNGEQADELVQSRKVRFLADFAIKVTSVIKPTFEDFANKIEDGRKFGRWSDNQTGAAKELAADVTIGEYEAEIMLTRQSSVARLSLRADQSRLEGLLATTYGNFATARRQDEAVWLPVEQISEASLGRHLSKFCNKVKAGIEQL